VTGVNLNSSGNAWGYMQIAAAAVHLGVNNALPVSAPVQMINASGSLDLNGFNQQIGGLYGSAGSVVNNSTNTATTLKVSSALSSNWVFTGSIANGGGSSKPLNLDVAGDTLTLTGAGNNYSGSTTVRSGATLALSTNGNITASTPIDVQAGGIFDATATTSGGYTLGAAQMLKGYGTFNGNLNANGTVSPGASIGTLNVTGNVTNSASTVMLMEVDNTGARTSDLLSATGVISYGGTLVITNISAVAYTNNQVLKLFNATGGYAGSFTTITFPGVTSYDASNLTVDGTV
jgi:hypothetical protein